jgi:hypothetical protein
VIVDEEREVYAKWGLGISSFWHILNPWSMYSVYTLGKQGELCFGHERWGIRVRR